MEEIVASHDSVAECAVFGVADEVKGQRPLGLIVLKSGQTTREEQLQQEIVQSIRDEIGAVASFKEVKVVKRLPKTRSGKILRKLLRNIADGVDFDIPSTIDDVAIIDEIRDVMQQRALS